jgi:hypothetical protein
MIPHQTTGVNLPVGLRARLGQLGEKQLPIRVVAEDRFPPVAAIHHVINRAGILNAELACYVSKSGRTKEMSQCVVLTPLRLRRHRWPWSIQNSALYQVGITR